MKWFWNKNKGMEAVTRQNWEIATELKIAEEKIIQLNKEIEMWKERGTRMGNAYDNKVKEHQEWVAIFQRHCAEKAKLEGYKQAVEQVNKLVKP